MKTTSNKLENNEISRLETEDEVSEYKCPKCRDLRFIIKDNEAIPCSCKAIREAEEILIKSGISEEFRKKTFNNFDYSYDMSIYDAFYKAKSYVNNFDYSSPSRNKSIMFVGQVGSGKTHLSMAIANSLMEKGVGVLYMPYRDNITSIKQNMRDEEYYRKATNKFKNAKVLLIDDLFKGNITGSDVNIMFEIVNFRYLNNLPLIVSSEKSIDEIMEIDEAIGSRLYEMSNGYVVNINGKKLNYRMHGKK